MTTTRALQSMTPEQFIGSYGTDWTPGVLSEHVELFQAQGGVIRTSASGRIRWAVAGALVAPVVCSELVAVRTEDGVITGRCGAHADAADGRCEGHR